MKELTRRDFVKATATAAVSILGAPSIGQAGRSPNERIRVAVVGLRNRGRRHLETLRALRRGNVEVAALCDVDENLLNVVGGAYEKNTGDRVDRAVDMRTLLDRSDIDAVILAVPNHWHALGTIWACQAGKDVYVEQPASHSIEEGREMLQAARRYGRIVQHGTQHRSSPAVREGIRLLHEGLIGKVDRARGLVFKIRPSCGSGECVPPPEGFHWNLWLGPAPEREWSRARVDSWRELWDYGDGEMGAEGIAQLDLIRWAMNLDDHPLRVHSMGDVFPLARKYLETPSTQVASFEYANRDAQVSVEIRNLFCGSGAVPGTGTQARDDRDQNRVVFYGTEGVLAVSDGKGYQTFLGDQQIPGPAAVDEDLTVADRLHLENFIEAVRTHNPSHLRADIEEGHYSASLCHLANIACRTERSLRFDPLTERFPEDGEACRQVRSGARYLCRGLDVS